ncbi:acyl-coenzyme A thioesterase 13 isoform X2 [Lingula anatina]|uniref:Acyl-coenzyme A thioesterase 13 n=1 Tax=Lingula anatina TaxID=7574 RepID=A0A2R2MPM1_LINAN|nr:acyl-coenzyme A thioesterase 13 isoform X2 [Lingula anatina]|eukprot:XP_023931962.1 acyl-coenzyme A thioesterase 13 isoform X2 [Lingula anatina]
MAGSNQVLRQVLNLLTKGSGFDQMRLISGGDGKCQCELTVEEEHTNRGGTLHGGMTATLVDSVSTVALMTTGPGLPGVSVDMNVTFMKSAKIGDDVIIDASTLKVGKTLAFLNVDLKLKKDGSLIAQGRHTKYLGNS